MQLVPALQQQQSVNPDDIFGGIPELRMSGEHRHLARAVWKAGEQYSHVRISDRADVFQGGRSAARYRVRSSSANWTGTDRMTAAEITAHSVRMGFA